MWLSLNSYLDIKQIVTIQSLDPNYDYLLHIEQILNSL